MRLKSFLTAWLTAGALLPAWLSAQEVGALPEPVQVSSDVVYVTGGIGQQEARAMQQESPRWPLALLFAVNSRPRAEFAADLKVVITDRVGNTALDAVNAGPYLLAKLPPGRYTVEAVYGGKTLKKQIQIRPGQHTRATLLWPTEPGVG